MYGQYVCLYKYKVCPHKVKYAVLFTNAESCLPYQSVTV